MPNAPDEQLLQDLGAAGNENRKEEIAPPFSEIADELEEEKRESDLVKEKPESESFDRENNLVFQPKNLKKPLPSAPSARLLSTAPPGGPVPDFALPVPLAPSQDFLKSLLTEVNSLGREMKQKGTQAQIENWRRHLTKIQGKISALESSPLPDSDFKANDSLAASKKSLKLTHDPAHLKDLSVKLDSLNRQMKEKATPIRILAWKQSLTEIQKEISVSS